MTYDFIPSQPLYRFSSTVIAKAIFFRDCVMVLEIALWWFRTGCRGWDHGYMVYNTMCAQFFKHPLQKNIIKYSYRGAVLSMVAHGLMVYGYGYWNDWFQSIYIFFGRPSLGVRPWWSLRRSGKNRRSRLCGGPEAEARWLRCPLARESDRGLNSSTAEQSAA